MKYKAVIWGAVLIVLLALAGCNGSKSGSGTTGEAQSAGNGVKLTTIDDLKDKRIGVLLGSTHDVYANKTFPQASVLQYKIPADLILGVKAGKVDAAIYNRETMMPVIRNDTELAFLEERVYSIPVGIGFHKENRELQEQFNAFLQQIKANGVLADMVNRWVENGVTEMPALDNPKTNGVLTVGMVSDKGLPFAIVKDNKLVGFDVELCQRFAAYLGKECKVADMEFGSLVAAVSANKVDMIASTLMITEERKQQIGFSNPYFDLTGCAFALKKNIVKYNGQTDKATELPLMQKLSDRFYNNLIQEKRYVLILDGLKTTAAIALLAVIFGTLLGAIVCFMRMSSSKAACLLAKTYIAVMRGVPVLVILMIVFYVVFGSVKIHPVVVAVLAFGMNFAVYVAEMFRVSIESIDKGQTEAGIAGGFTPAQTFLYIVLPQAIRRVIPVYKGEFISLVKMTSIVGYIAVQDLTKASDIIRSRTFDDFFPLTLVAVLYFLVSWSLALVLDYVEDKTDPKSSRKVGQAAND